MSMRLQHNFSRLQITNILKKNESVAQKNLQQIATGMKINNAGDNPSDYAISERLRTNIRSLNQVNQNVQNDNALLNTALGGNVNIVEKLRTLKALAINAANASATNEDRRAIQKEVNQIIDSIDDNTKVAFNGKKLIDGSACAETKETATVLMNSALAKNTTRYTALTALRNRNGTLLGISSSDTVTASYVHSGKTYTTKFRVGSSTVETIFRKLNRIDESVFGSVEDTETNEYSTSTIDEGMPEPTPPSDDGFKDGVLSLLGGLLSFCFVNYDAMSNEVINFLLGDWPDEILEQQSDGSYKNLSNWTKTEAWQNLSDDAKNYITRKSSRLNGILTDSKYLKALSEYNEAVNQYLSDLEEYNAYQQEMSIDIVKSSEKGLIVEARQKGIAEQITAMTISVSDKAGNLKSGATATLNNFKTVNFATDSSKDNSLNFQIGDSAEQVINMGLNDLRATTLGLKGSNGNYISVSNQTAAQVAMVAFDNAMQRVMNQVVDIGAVEEWLGYTAENITTAQENLQASDSVIRDAEIPQAINDFAKNKLLTQIARLMLVQFNKSPKAILGKL